jgi:hypothetical protein
MSLEHPIPNELLAIRRETAHAQGVLKYCEDVPRVCPDGLHVSYIRDCEDFFRCDYCLAVRAQPRLAEWIVGLHIERGGKLPPEAYP